jgi:hypothetical protein
MHEPVSVGMKLTRMELVWRVCGFAHGLVSRDIEDCMSLCMCCRSFAGIDTLTTLLMCGCFRGACGGTRGGLDCM